MRIERNLKTIQKLLDAGWIFQIEYSIFVCFKVLWIELSATYVTRLIPY